MMGNVTKLNYGNMSIEEKYAPLSVGEFTELKEFTENQGLYLQTSQMTYVWTMYNRLRNSREPQPCSCKSSGGLWKGAVDYLVNFVKERSSGE
jgi:hypothetical protein